MPEPVYWEWLTHEEIGALRSGGMDMVILPVGSTEQHGPHLSVNVDTVSAVSVANMISAKTGVSVLPALPYGSALGHTEKWPGTVSLSPTTLTNVVVEIGEWIYKCSGFSRVLLLNGHMTNYAALRSALEILRYKHPEMRIAVRGLWEISDRVASAYTSDAYDWHANSAETSLMMALHPQGVRQERIVDDEDRTEGLFFSYPVNRTSRWGATGRPTLATAADGHRLFNWIVDDLSQQVAAALREEAPFDQES